MVNNTKQAIEKINDVSRQLLSRILIVQNIIQEKPAAQTESMTNKQASSKQVTDD